MSDQTPETGDQLARRYDNLAARWTDRGDIEADRRRRARGGECPHDQGQAFFGQITVDGKRQVWKGCRICGHDGERRGFLPHGDIDFDTVTWIRDDLYQNPPCQVCGNFGTQLHHWAPREIFGEEADHWPTGWLCPPCHDVWHQRMSQPARQDRRTS